MRYSGQERRNSRHDRRRNDQRHKREVMKGAVGLVMIAGATVMFFYGPVHDTGGHALLYGLVLFGALLIDKNLPAQVMGMLRPAPPPPPQIRPPDD